MLYLKKCLKNPFCIILGIIIIFIIILLFSEKFSKFQKNIEKFSDVAKLRKCMAIEKPDTDKITYNFSFDENTNTCYENSEKIISNNENKCNNLQKYNKDTKCKYYWDEDREKCLKKCEYTILENKRGKRRNKR